MIAYHSLAKFMITRSVQVNQQSRGWCSPNVAHVVGNVFIYCYGVDPRALQRLNRELKKKNLQIRQALKEAEEWTKQYQILQSELNDENGNALAREAEDYLHKGELEKAGQILDRLLGVDERNVSRAAADHYSRGLLFELQFKPIEALPHLEKAYRYRPDNIPYGIAYGDLLLRQHAYEAAEQALTDTLSRLLTSHSQSNRDLVYEISLRGDLGVIYKETHKFKEAEQAYLRVIEVSRKLKRQYSLAEALGSLGSLYIQLNEFTKAEGYLSEASKLIYELKKSAPERYSMELAHISNSLAIVYIKTQRQLDAEKKIDATIDIYRREVQHNQASEPLLAGELTNAGLLYADMQEFRKSECAFAESVSRLKRLSKDNPDAYSRTLATALLGSAHLFSVTKQFDKAAADYQETVDIFKKLYSISTHVYGADLAEALINFGNFHVEIAQWSAAEDNFRESICIYRPLVNNNPEAYKPDLSLALNGQGRMYFEHAKYNDAAVPLRESYDIRSALSAANPITFQADLAITANNLALVLAALGQMSEAETLYLQSASIRQALYEKSPEIYGSGLASTLYNLGCLYQFMQRNDEAKASFTKSLKILCPLYKKNPNVYAKRYNEVRLKLDVITRATPPSHF